MKLTIKSKLIIGFGLILLLIIILGITSFYTNNEMQSLNSQLEEEMDNMLYFLEQELNHINWVNDLGMSIMAREKFDGELDYTACEFGEEYYTILESEDFQDFSEELQQIFLSMEEPHRELHQSAEEILEIQNDDSLDADQQYWGSFSIYQHQTLAHAEELQGYFNELNEYFRQQTDSHLIHIENRTQFVNRVTIGLSLLVIVIVLLVSYVLYNSISDPIRKALGFAEDIAEGDLTVESMEMQNEDEIAELLAALNRMKDQLNKIIVNLFESIEDLSAYSQELSASAQEGNASIETTSQLIKDMSVSIKEISASSQEVADFSQEANEHTDIGTQNINETVNTIKEINDKVNETVEVINELDQNSDEIGQIVDLITNIAEQTNLLALNAAIEAARAGEHGKGFAVVAEEIRQLASETSQATDEISDLVNKTQNQSKKVIEKVKEIENKAKDGENVAEKTGDVFNDIKNRIEKTSLQIEQTSNTAQDLAENSDEVNRATNDIEDMATNITQSSQELANMTQNLQKIIEQFKV